MSFHSSFKFFATISFGSDYLCESREDITKDIQFLSDRVKKDSQSFQANPFHNILFFHAEKTHFNCN